MQTIELLAPITVGGATLTAINLRRPKAKDFKRWEKLKLADVERTLRIICDLAEITPEQADDLDGADLKKVGEVIEGFLSGGQ